MILEKLNVNVTIAIIIQKYLENEFILESLKILFHKFTRPGIPYFGRMKLTKVHYLKDL